MERKPRRVLFLNPPFREGVFRDCYCSGTTSRGFLRMPLDLQIQSGYFSCGKFVLEFIDCVYEGLDDHKALQRMSAFSPDIVFSLLGATAFEQDKAFLQKARRLLPSTTLFLTGDLARFQPERIFEEMPFVEGILMNFTSSGLLDYLNGMTNPMLVTPGSSRRGKQSYLSDMRFPLPNEQVSTKYSYRLPFFRSPKYYSLIATYGCPFQCAYCNTHLLGFANRAVGDVIQELHHAKSLGFKSLYIRDACFMAERRYAMSLFEEWRKSRLDFEWICFARPGTIDRELARQASHLGCRLMMFGVETYDEPTLQRVNRNIPVSQIETDFRTAREYGIRTAANLLIGLEERDERVARNNREYESGMMSLIRRVNPDYISVNVLAERPGIKTENVSRIASEQNGCNPIRLRNRINRKFLLHPRRILEQLFAIRGLEQMKYVLTVASEMVASSWRK